MGSQSAAVTGAKVTHALWELGSNTLVCLVEIHSFLNMLECLTLETNICNTIQSVRSITSKVNSNRL